MKNLSALHERHLEYPKWGSFIQTATKSCVVFSLLDHAHTLQVVGEEAQSSRLLLCEAARKAGCLLACLLGWLVGDHCHAGAFQELPPFRVYSA